jgi:hypothetical protein
MKKPLRRLLQFLAVVSATGIAIAANEAFFATLALKDGRLLHNVKVLNIHPLTINVKADEGLLQINKNLLPPELAKNYPMDFKAAEAEEKAARVSAEVSRRLEEERHRQVLELQRRHGFEMERKDVYNGCRILSFSGSSPESVIVEIRNETDRPMFIPSRTILGRSSDNQVYTCVWYVPPSLPSRKSEEIFTVPGNATTKAAVVFLAPSSAEIVEVFWPDH